MAILWYLSRINEDNPEKVSLDQWQVCLKKAVFTMALLCLKVCWGRAGCTEKFGNRVISFKYWMDSVQIAPPIELNL